VRIVRLASPQGMSFGVLDGDGQVAQIEGHPFGQISFTGQRFPQADVRLLSPILPSKVVAIGKNYADHVAEMKGVTGGDAPTEPLFFLKPNTAVVGPGDAIVYPSQSHNVHYEGELAIVIGRICKDVPLERAAEVIYGWTIANDVSARDLQVSDGQWSRAKGFDTFCPLGPWIETELSLDDVKRGLRVQTFLDGDAKQDGNTRDLIFDVPTIIAHVTSAMTLLPGDVILTGTPAGVGPMQPGQEVEVSIERLGALTNTVVKK
jgi:2-keto-4-pentenoate hydratase/2-oxohepta-3-ene-1,7-dioic acid hydratase in catechol pathway